MRVCASGSRNAAEVEARVFKLDDVSRDDGQRRRLVRAHGGASRSSARELVLEERTTRRTHSRGAEIEELVREQAELRGDDSTRRSALARGPGRFEQLREDIRLRTRSTRCGRGEADPRELADAREQIGRRKGNTSTDTKNLDAEQLGKGS